MPAVTVLDSTMHYEETGTGTPFVFLHGNPTSSHIWRHVLPAMGPGVRGLAPDLIGMGQSGKPDIGYSFADHARYLDAFIDALGLDKVVLVGHDWGGALAFDWAARHPGRVLGTAFFETIVRPMSWAELSEAARTRFEAFRSPAGESLVLDKNMFIETFPKAILSGLRDDDHNVYRAPYPTRESRRPMLAWARSMPLDGEPADVVARIGDYDRWLAATPGVPKLLLTFDSSPTLLIDEPVAAWCAANIAGLQSVHLGPAGHHAAEDKPHEIAAAILDWAGRHHLTAAVTLSPQILGQAENAHAAVLARELAGTGVTKNQWIALNLIAAAGTPATADEVRGRIVGAVKIDSGQAGAVIGDLRSAGLLAGEDKVQVTEAGLAFLGRVRGATGAIVNRAYRDIPDEDLEAAGRVLSVITARLNSELAVAAQAGEPGN
jgi:haloalkane dehalogenase